MALASYVLNCYAERNRHLRQMGFADYEHYLGSSLWRGIRRRVWERDSFACYACGGRACQVHHGNYCPAVLKGERLKGLYSVCEACHKWAEVIHGAKLSPHQATQRLKRRREELLRPSAPPLDANISP